MPELFHDFGTAPLTFQMGVPSQDAFPAKLWSRILTREARAAAAAPVSYPDPRGHPDLRREVAAYLAIARGVRCSPSQVIITAGYAGALGLAVRGLQLEGQKAWIEDPGFPLTRTALGLAGLSVAPVPVDEEGLDLASAVATGGDAALAVVTPGQQAPLGMTMSLARRFALLDWARANEAWILEDDYLSELQLKGRAAPALASLDQCGRVLHAGSFSKTISPALRLGFLVVPPALARAFGDLAACLAPAPAVAVQRAVATFLREGHYLRHLRRMKRLYAARREALARSLRSHAANTLSLQATAGLAVVVALPENAGDVDIALSALPYGLAPVPLSPWYMGGPPRRGLLLGVTNLDERRLAADCRRLAELSKSGNVVCSVLMAPMPPTRRMSAKNGQRRWAMRNRTRLWPARMYQASTTAVSVVARTTAQPPPAMPSAGMGPRPKISTGESGRRRTTPSQTASAGTSMLPVPRITLANAFITHTSTLPAKTTLEYSSAASSEPPSPPMAV